MTENRFEEFEEKDNEIEDKLWGIVWRKHAERTKKGNEGEILSLSWSDALAHAWSESKKSEQGFDWRLPTVEELSSIINIDDKDGKPEVDEVFQDVKGVFWTSSPVADDSDRAWVVYFHDGCVNWLRRDNDSQVRLVRGVSRSVVEY